MKIIHQTTSLRTIIKEDIEQIRIWRNDDIVNRYLKTRDFIDAETQINWFNSLNPSKSIYFMMEDSVTPFGIIYAQDISLNEKSFWGNVLTGNANYMNTHLPIKAILMLFVFFFDYLNFESIYSKVHCDNLAALTMNKRFGFKEFKEEGNFILEQCKKHDFELEAKVLINALLRNIPLKIILEKEDEKYVFLKDFSLEQV